MFTVKIPISGPTLAGQGVGSFTLEVIPPQNPWVWTAEGGRSRQAVSMPGLRKSHHPPLLLLPTGRPEGRDGRVCGEEKGQLQRPVTASASAPFPGGRAASEADQRFCLVRSVGDTWLLSGSAGWCGLPACWGADGLHPVVTGPQLGHCVVGSGGCGHSE